MRLGASCRRQLACCTHWLGSDSLDASRLCRCVTPASPQVASSWTPRGSSLVSHLQLVGRQLAKLGKTNRCRPVLLASGTRANIRYVKNSAAKRCLALGLTCSLCLIRRAGLLSDLDAARSWFLSWAASLLAGASRVWFATRFGALARPLRLFI